MCDDFVTARWGAEACLTLELKILSYLEESEKNFFLVSKVNR